MTMEIKIMSTTVYGVENLILCITEGKILRQQFYSPHDQWKFWCQKKIWLSNHSFDYIRSLDRKCAVFEDLREGQCSLNKESKWKDDIKSHWRFKERPNTSGF